MCNTESGGNFGVDYPLALACGQVAKSGSSFQMKFWIPFPIILSFERAARIAQRWQAAAPKKGASYVQR